MYIFILIKDFNNLFVEKIFNYCVTRLIITWKNK